MLLLTFMLPLLPFHFLDPTQRLVRERMAA
jgi:hypothetical protein